MIERAIKSSILSRLEDGKAKRPVSFLSSYPNATFTAIHPDNMDDFLL